MPSSSCQSAERIPGWEDRLFTVINAARTRPYVLGENDCFRLACAVVEALTGKDLSGPWKGAYSSKREALRRIAEFDARGFTAAASRLFSVPPQTMPNARRGDICEYVDDAGEQHLGVVLGTMVAVMGPDRMEFVQRELCAHCWRIG